MSVVELDLWRDCGIQSTTRSHSYPTESCLNVFFLLNRSSNSVLWERSNEKQTCARSLSLSLTNQTASPQDPRRARACFNDVSPPPCATRFCSLKTCAIIGSHPEIFPPVLPVGNSRNENESFAGDIVCGTTGCDFIKIGLCSSPFCLSARNCNFNILAGTLFRPTASFCCRLIICLYFRAGNSLLSSRRACKI